MGRKIAFSTAFKAILTFNCYQNLKWWLSGLFKCILIEYRSCKDHFSCVGFHLEDDSTCQHLNSRDDFLSSWANDTKGMCVKLILNIWRFYMCGLVLWPFFSDMKNIYQSLALYRYFAPISVYAEIYFPASTMITIGIKEDDKTYKKVPRKIIQRYNSCTFSIFKVPKTVIYINKK